MENFEFLVSTNVIFGKGEIKRLSQVMENYGRKLLLVYGGGSIKKNGIYDDVKRLLADYDITELSGVAANPKIESVYEGIRLCKENGIEAILTIGGGSVIDCSKVVAVGACTDTDILEMLESHGGIPIEKALPVVTIPTVAATGSETDCGAVVVNTAKGEKVSVMHPAISLAVSILDPTYTFTVSARQTAAGCADIMSHLMEQYFVPQSNYMADLMVESVMKTIVKYARTAMDEPDNYEARAQIFWASEIADNATLCNGNMLAAFGVHAMEHQLSGGFNTTHGEGLAILTPAWMEYVLSEQTALRFAHFGKSVFGVGEGMDDMAAAKAAIRALRDFFASLDMPKMLTELGIKNADFETMSEIAEAEGTTYAWIPLSAKDIAAIYASCM